MAIEQCQSQFLALPQEVRDLIYSFTFGEMLPPPTEFKEFVDDREVSTATLPSVFGIDVQPIPFKIHYPSTAPTPSWYSLSMCCARTANDIREYFSSKAKHTANIRNENNTAILTLALTSTTATPTWSYLPTARPSNLHVDLQVTHMFDSALLTPYPSQKDNRALRTLFNILRRCILNGPHLARPSPLSAPIQVDTMTISVSPAWKFEDMQFYFGNPKEQLGFVVEGLRAWLEGFCRSGVLLGKVNKVELICHCLEGEWNEGREQRWQWKWDVSGDVWDEEVVVRFGALGYRWA